MTPDRINEIAERWADSMVFCTRSEREDLIRSGITEATAELRKEMDETHGCLLRRETTLKQSGEDWAKAMTERDQWRAMAEELAVSGHCNCKFGNTCEWCRAMSKFNALKAKLSADAAVSGSSPRKSERTETVGGKPICTFPDCGCAEFRLCMARDPNTAALSLNRSLNRATAGGGAEPCPNSTP